MLLTSYSIQSYKKRQWIPYPLPVYLFKYLKGNLPYLLPPLELLDPDDLLPELLDEEPEVLELELPDL